MESPGSSYYRPWEGVGDLVGAASGWERSGCCCDGYHHSSSSFSPSYFGDGTLFAVLAAGALAFYVLYSTITMAAGGAGDQGAAGFFRSKRNSASDSNLGDWMVRGSLPGLAHSFLGFRSYSGLQEFQEAEGEDRWMSEISINEDSLLTRSEFLFIRIAIFYILM